MAHGSKLADTLHEFNVFLAAEVKCDGTVETVETGGPQPVIRFTTDHVVARDTPTMDRLLSVYQDDANVVADENPARRHLLRSLLGCVSIPS